MSLGDARSVRVELNRKRCGEVADLLKRFSIPEDREDEALPGLLRESIPNFYFFLVAICHQTSPRGLPPVEGVVGGQRRVGWDFLWAAFSEHCVENGAALSPASWSVESPDRLASVFSDRASGQGLTDLNGRADLIRDLGTSLLSLGLSSVHGLHALCGGRLRRCSEGPGLLDRLALFRAYSDPVQKKSIFFLSLMRNHRLWSYVDDAELEAPVDYHEVRGHLRLGTVVIADAGLRENVQAGVAVDYEADVEIRSVTRDVIRCIADAIAVSPSRAHYLFWNLFRSICTRDAPQCGELSPENPLPERYVHLVQSGGRRVCPFGEICDAYAAKHFLMDHVVETEYY